MANPTPNHHGMGTTLAGNGPNVSERDHSVVDDPTFRSKLGRSEAIEKVQLIACFRWSPEEIGGQRMAL